MGGEVGRANYVSSREVTRASKTRAIPPSAAVLLWGRYKNLYASTADPDEKAGYLDNAIHQYSREMRLDFNDYYPSSKLPRLRCDDAPL